MNYIYEIRNIITNKRYIGRTNNPRKRKTFSRFKKRHSSLLLFAKKLS
ncbi:MULTISPECIES: GIY-YIG nuclease family protein [Clostridium]|nr:MULTISPECIES: GIY-YIG nuclease family protein [Clostridium]MDI9217789.1 GIY-YIG nuclease family protein [Clostridium tertium]